jgi:hypothetical protein
VLCMASVQYPSTRHLTGRAGQVFFWSLRLRFCAQGRTLTRSFLGLKLHAFTFARFRAPSFLHLYVCALNFFSRYWFPFALPVSFSPGVSIYIHSHTHTVHTSPHPYIHLHTHTYYVHPHTHTYTHTHICTVHTPHTHTYIQKYIHTYTQI